jgi:hypothetical protein
MMARREWMRDSTAVVLRAFTRLSDAKGRDTGRHRASQPQKPSAKGDFHFCRK